MEYMKSLPDNAFDLIVTSPPYNMRTRIRDGEYTVREKSEHFSKKYKNFDDALSIDDYFTFHSEAIKQMLRLSKVIIYNIQIVTGSKEALFKMIGLFHKEIKDIVIWDKGHGQPAMHDGVLNKATELILILEQNAKAGRCFNVFNFERGTLSDIWRIPREKSEVAGHAATYPVRLAETAIVNFSKTGDLVFDPFMGTGTTGIAALMHDRNFHGCELDVDYFEAACKRIKSEAAQERLFA
jgi:site-specific DNA-methyltransferase (adenine-specific)/modification methylase